MVFPDYERVISADNDKVVTLDRSELAGTIKRTSLMTEDRARAILLELEPDQLTLKAANPDLGEATEAVWCDYGGEPVRLGLNPDYLADFLNAADTEEVVLELKDEKSQVVARPVDGLDKRYVCIIMPVAL